MLTGTPPSRTASGIIAATIALMVVAGCGSNRTETNAYAWKASSHVDTTLTVIIITGPDDTDFRAEVVSETATSVVIGASYHFSTGSSTSNGVFRNVEVDLNSPIGNRTVFNRDGTTVPEQPN